MIKKPQKDFILKLYQHKNTVFTLREMAMLFPELSAANLKSRINYYVKSGKIKSVRRSIYVKAKYNEFELATKIYSPAYISLETVLAKEGVVFQYYSTIFVVSYLPREIKVDGQIIQYRRIKEEILLNKDGVIQKDNYAIASKERAFLDALYLYKKYYFDNLDSLDNKRVNSLLPLYQSKALEKKVNQLLQDA